jgi:3-deoxy-7-phosphoheptulonate synthase
MQETHDLRVETMLPLAPPQAIKAELPLTERAAETVSRARHEIEAILDGRDDRLLVIVGPCSIHDPEAAKRYAQELQMLRARHAGELLIVMRGYFEKPRTSVGWKGLINDPHLDGTCDVAHGLRVARKLLLELAELGVPTANEALDPVMPQYLADLISWSAIGARTTESQTHREMASGLSMPVGFKNGTDGGLDVAVNAMRAARAPHSFVGIDGGGCVAVVRTRGNPYSHVVLRGGRNGPNFAEAEVSAAARQLGAAGLQSRVLIDCSHDNSRKNYENQAIAASDVAGQVARGSRDVLGVMLESHLVAGRQDLVDAKSLVFGQSITDACIDVPATALVLEELAGAVAHARRRSHLATPVTQL